MMEVEEKRRFRRMDLESNLIIKRIDNGMEDYIKIGTHDLSLPAKAETNITNVDSGR